jgi:hypothetical protein
MLMQAFLLSGNYITLPTFQERASAFKGAAHRPINVSVQATTGAPLQNAWQ